MTVLEIVGRVRAGEVVTIPARCLDALVRQAEVHHRGPLAWRVEVDGTVATITNLEGGAS